MKTAFRTCLAASGLAAALLAAPAMAELLPSDQERIIKGLTEQGFTDVAITQDGDDDDVTVMGTRDGMVHTFDYDETNGSFLPVGQTAGSAPTPIPLEGAAN